jgi:hypothetical protein
MHHHLGIKVMLLFIDITIMRGFRKHVIEAIQRRRQSRFQPYNRGWHGLHELYTKWIKQTSRFIKELICCALCGMTRMHNKKQHYKVVPNSYTNAYNPKSGCTQYGMANALLADHTTNANGEKMNVCLKYKSNINAPPNSKYVVYQSPSYFNFTVSSHPLYVQLLSFLDIGIHIESRNWGFSTGEIIETSLLNNPLLCWDGVIDRTPLVETISSSLGPILNQNMDTNPTFKDFFTVSEQLQKSNSMCILSTEIVKSTIDRHRTDSPTFPTMNVEDSIHNLTLLFDMRNTQGSKKNSNYYTIGNVCKRLNNENKLCEEITFKSNTLNSSTHYMTMEYALFLFLFLHGHGWYDSNCTFNKYIKHRMSSQFSPFILYKPYLLYMYDLKQSLKLIQETSHTCLDNDIKRAKQMHPQMSEPEVIRHVTKYNLPTSLQGTPRWRKAQLQDLLAMVEKCSMPHLFLTLIADEISSFRWEEVTDIETIAKKLKNSFTWKDCPVKCATLFHARVTKFMNDIILFGTRALGHVKDYLIRYELQHHGSLHAHIILWIQEDDAE